MTETLSVSIARMQEQMRSLLQDSTEAKESRRELHKKVNVIEVQQLEIGNRLKTLEQQMSNAAPTLAEFVEMKHKIAGAGVLGRWLWVVGGFIIGTATWLVARSEWLKHLFNANN